MDNNKNLILKFLDERVIWRNKIDMLKQDNEHLKTRLGNIIKFINGTNEDILEKLEIFQNKLIQNDQFIRLLRDDLTNQERLLNDCLEITNNCDIQKLNDHQAKLRSELLLFENGFASTASDFKTNFGFLDNNKQIHTF